MAAITAIRMLMERPTTIPSIRTPITPIRIPTAHLRPSSNTVLSSTVLSSTARSSMVLSNSSNMARSMVLSNSSNNRMLLRHTVPRSSTVKDLRRLRSRLHRSRTRRLVMLRRHRRLRNPATATRTASGTALVRRFPNKTRRATQPGCQSYQYFGRSGLVSRTI
jgi:hypothetical protein